jgi:hypothetical protein
MEGSWYLSLGLKIYISAGEIRHGPVCNERNIRCLHRTLAIHSGNGCGPKKARLGATTKDDYFDLHVDILFERGFASMPGRFSSNELKVSFM